MGRVFHRAVVPPPFAPACHVIIVFGRHKVHDGWPQVPDLVAAVAALSKLREYKLRGSRHAPVVEPTLQPFGDFKIGRRALLLDAPVWVPWPQWWFGSFV